MEPREGFLGESQKRFLTCGRKGKVHEFGLLFQRSPVVFGLRDVFSLTAWYSAASSNP